MPDTYSLFVVGYLLLWLTLFGVSASLWIKISRLEKSLGLDKNESSESSNR